MKNSLDFCVLRVCFCSEIMVNSEFTATVFRQAFPSLAAHALEVVYPPCDHLPPLRTLETSLPVAEPFFLSLNRYERKKGIGVALLSFAQVRGDS